MRLFLFTGVKNEGSRYLASMLAWHYWMFDGMFVYDDQSTDNTVEIAKSFGAVVAQRPDHAPSFLDHEGQFRQYAWAAFETVMQPTQGDWVLALDADEFLVSLHGTTTAELYRMASTATTRGAIGVDIKIPEVFSLNHNPFIRTDGYWGGLSAPRFFAYCAGGMIKDVPMGCGSAPTYVSGGTCLPAEDALHILHYGYAKQADREAKYERYKGRSGHNPNHIESILQKGQLVEWTGSHPKIRDEVYR